MSRYIQAIDRQMTWHEWLKTDRGKEIWLHKEERISPGVSMRSTYGVATLTTPTRPFFEMILGKGTAIWVSKEMCAYLEHLVATLPGDASFQHTMLPTPLAFVAFERPVRLPVVESMGMSIPMSAMGWVALKNRPNVQGYQIAYDHDDYELDTSLGAPNDLRTQCCVFVNSDRGFFPYSYYGFGEGNNVADRVQSFETKFSEADIVHGNGGQYGSDLQYHEMRYFLTLLLLMEQRILVHKNYTVDRAARRRAIKAGIPADHVKVIHFRRYENPDVEATGPGGPANYSHRFMVRAHWRQQWYPSTGIHKPKLVQGYIKGAAHLPLKYDQRTVMAVVR